MYHETLWVAVSAAAPVIALAAIVAFNDTGNIASSYRLWDVEHPISDYSETRKPYADQITTSYNRTSVAIIVICLTNTILQALALSFGLSSLASGVDELPVEAAIAAEVAGIALLACGAITNVQLRFVVDQFIMLKGPTGEGRSGRPS